jgi:phosphatidylserine/phosphatidylglycerophosphate/cardiolipin synthase-like enzyme
MRKVKTFKQSIQMAALTAAIFFFSTSCSEDSSLDLDASTDFCDNIHRNDSITLSDELKSYTELMDSSTGVYVLEDGVSAMVSRAWLSEYAEESIDIQYFIFSVDNVGLIACDYLVRAADRGVMVRILVDDIMVDAGIEEVLALDSHENISVKIYNPGVNLGRNLFNKIQKFTTEFRSANQRMHNKTFIVDHKVVITGGRNMADEYFDYDHEYNFRDRDVLLIGNGTKQVSTSFNTFWTDSLSVPITKLTDEKPEATDPTQFDGLHEYACNPENFWPQIRNKIENLPTVFKDLAASGEITWVKQIQFISDEPGKNETTTGLGGGGRTTTALMKLIASATKTIDIQTPYLITTNESRALLSAAVKRGVRIRILTNSLASTDNIEAFSAYQASRKELLETGVRVFEFKPDAEISTAMMKNDLYDSLGHIPTFGLHAKSMVIDGETTIIGTFNWDPRSANLNTECITVISSEEVSKGILDGMRVDIQSENAWETTPQFNPDSEVGKVKRLKTWTRRSLPDGIL